MTKPGPCEEGGVKSCCPDEGVPGERERTGEGEESDIDVCIFGREDGVCCVERIIREEMCGLDHVF
jgi:hypothetical protein